MGIGQKVKDVLTPGSKHDSPHGTTDQKYNTTMGSTQQTGAACETCVPAQQVDTAAPVQRTEQASCGTETFTVTEDRPRVIEQREAYLEHRPVEKQYEQQVREVGEHALEGSTEHLGTTTRVVSEAQPAAPCEGISAAKEGLRQKESERRAT